MKNIIIYLEKKPQPYLLQIDFNLKNYKIKKGYLYKKHKKLGKIRGFETNDY